MLLLRALPDLSDTPVNAGFRRFFYSKWGKENSLLSARARRAEYPLYVQRLSIKAAWGGAERYHVDGRTIAVDDDNYLVLNDLRKYGSVLSATEPVHSFSIFFRPGLAEETLGGMLTPADRMLDRGLEASHRPVEFAELLRPHDRNVTPALRYIAHNVDSGFEDEMWYEEQLSFLLERMLFSHRSAIATAQALSAVRPSTRSEVFRRIGWASDFIHSQYRRPLTTFEIADAARLSRFHFIRLFRAVHTLTPYAYLQRKRATVARRLLQTTSLGQEEIALRAGFDHRSTMFRQLRRWTGKSGRAIRTSHSGEATTRR